MIERALRQTQALMALFVVGTGITCGDVGSTIGASEHPQRAFYVVLAGVLVFITGAVLLGVVAPVQERRLRNAVRDASAALLAGGDLGEPVPARVVRHRPAPGHPGFAADAPMPAGSPATPDAVFVLLVALAPDGARRVAALVPPVVLSGLRARQEVRVLLAPKAYDTAVLAARPTPGAQDPRWGTVRLPTSEWRIAWAVALGALLVGVVLGFVVGRLVG